MSAHPQQQNQQQHQQQQPPQQGGYDDGQGGYYDDQAYYDTDYPQQAGPDAYYDDQYVPTPPLAAACRSHMYCRYYNDGYGQEGYYDQGQGYQNDDQYYDNYDQGNGQAYGPPYVLLVYCHHHAHSLPILVDQEAGATIPRKTPKRSAISQ